MKQSPRITFPVRSNGAQDNFLFSRNSKFYFQDAMLSFSVVKVASTCGSVAIEIQFISKLFTFFFLNPVPEKK